jgi:hypothetical protein
VTIALGASWRIAADLALEQGEWRTFGAGITGELLFFLAWFGLPVLPDSWDPSDYPLLLPTLVFGLPLLVFGPRDRRVIRALVYLGGFPLAHQLAFHAAFGSLKHLMPGNSWIDRLAWTDSISACGAVGGLIGGGGALLICWVGGLVRRDRRISLVLGTLLLSAAGAIGLGAAELDMFHNLWTVFTYAIWQLVFAYVLAKVLSH